MTQFLYPKIFYGHAMIIGNSYTVSYNMEWDIYFLQFSNSEKLISFKVTTNYSMTIAGDLCTEEKERQSC